MSRFFINRPIVAMVISIIMVIVGVVSFLSLHPNIDQVLTQMRESQAEAQLPADVKNFGVTVAKSMAAPLMVISLYSPSGQFDSTFLANYAYINLNDPIVRVPGIASVSVFGAGQYALRIWVDPNKLAAPNITTPEIESAIQAQNTVNPVGQVGGQPIPPAKPLPIPFWRRDVWSPSNSSATS